MKTKNILLMLAAYSFLAESFAQLPDSKEKKWQIGVSIGSIEDISYLGDLNSRHAEILSSGKKKEYSYNLGLNISRKMGKAFSIRMPLKRTAYNVEVPEGDKLSPPISNPYQIKTWAVKSSMLNVSPGLLWSFKYKMLDPYGGFEVVFKKYNPVIIDRVISWYDTANNITSRVNTNFKQDGGYSFGVGSFLGCSVNIFSHLSIGTELAYSFTFYKLGGEINVTDTNLLAPYNSSNQIWHGEAEGFHFSNVTGLINISAIF